jgi:hypothetical protein
MVFIIGMFDDMQGHAVRAILIRILKYECDPAFGYTAAYKVSLQHVMMSIYSAMMCRSVLLF